MRKVWTLLTAAVLSAFLAAPDSAAAAGWGASWQMNETSGPMLDATGNGNVSSSIGAGITRNGRSYSFTGRGVVLVPSSPTITPGSRDFTLQMSIDFWGGGDRNVVQKGQNTASTFYKFEVVGEDMVCYFKGSNGVATVRALDRDDVIAHKGLLLIQCRKTATQIGIKIGSEPWITRNVAVGSISNSQDMAIGGKPRTAGNGSNDYFAGNFDYVNVVSPGAW